MKTFTTCFAVLIGLTVFFGIKDLTVETVLQAIMNKGWGTVWLWFGDGENTAQNRQLPPNQGDDSESIKSIDELEDIE